MVHAAAALTEAATANKHGPLGPCTEDHHVPQAGTCCSQETCPTGHMYCRRSRAAPPLLVRKHESQVATFRVHQPRAPRRHPRPVCEVRFGLCDKPKQAMQKPKPNQAMFDKLALNQEQGG